MDPDEDEDPRNWHPLWADLDYDKLLLLCHTDPKGLLSIVDTPQRRARGHAAAGPGRNVVGVTS